MHSASFPCLLLSIRLSSDALEPMSECGYSNSPLLVRDAKPGDAKLCGITTGIFSEPTNRTEPCLPPIRPIISTFNLIIFKLIRLVEQNFSLLLFVAHPRIIYGEVEGSNPIFHPHEAEMEPIFTPTFFRTTYSSFCLNSSLETRRNSFDPRIFIFYFHT